MAKNNNNNSNLTPPPTNIPISISESGAPTPPWALWFNQLYQKLVGTNPSSNSIQSTNLTISGKFASADDTFITQTANSGLPNSQALTSLKTGFLQVDNSTGELSSTGSSQIRSEDIQPSGVTPGVYGSVNQTPTLTVNSQGQITNIETNQPPFALSGSNADVQETYALQVINMTQSTAPGSTSSFLILNDQGFPVLEIPNILTSNSQAALQLYAEDGAIALKAVRATGSSPEYMALCSTSAYVMITDLTTSSNSILRLAGNAGNGYTQFVVPFNQSTNLSLTLPAVDATSAGQPLVSNAAGVLSFASISPSAIITAMPKTDEVQATYFGAL